MEEFLALILQFIAELVFEICLNLEIWPNPLAKSKPGKVSIEAALGWLFAGGAIGWGWSKLFPAFFIHHVSLRLLNLIIGPLLSAVLGYKVAKHRSQRDPKITPRVHFWYSFWFTLGMVALRFAFVPR